ncbi:helix-turn-helix transcriptional regulator [Kitasatospora sp. NPDC059673]|uniref:helix-turn-helix transcriptional regulator n=1 Tax=Kitasatospora sp. NPDC059673 TaxID=3346901 RepID=UPI00368E6ACD
MKKLAMGGPLAELRAKLGLTQTQLAMEAGASISAVQSAELGTARDIAEPILEWADLLGIDSLGLSRRYREWKKGIDRGGALHRNAAEVLNRVFFGRRESTVIKQLRTQAAGVVFCSCRKRAGMTSTEVARALGITAYTFRAWESGKSSPSVDRALAASGWDHAYLFTSATPIAPVHRKPASRPAPPPAKPQPSLHHCRHHNARARPGVEPCLPCQPDARYRATSLDGTVRGYATDCAVKAANDAYFAERHTGRTFAVEKV